MGDSFLKGNNESNNKIKNFYVNFIAVLFFIIPMIFYIIIFDPTLGVIIFHPSSILLAVMYIKLKKKQGKISSTEKINEEDSE